MAALEQLEAAYAEVRHDPVFWSELRELLGRYAGRPTPLYRADRLAYEALERAVALDPAARLPRRLRLHLKREDLAHTGAHKINNALGQALLTRRLGKERVIAETGAGQHGVATATACALLDLPCVVFMGAVDIERQQPNVLRMQALGAEVRPVTSRHGDAEGRGQRRDARLGHERRDDPLRPRLGDGPASLPDDRPRPPAPDRRRGGRPGPRVEGRLPDLALACVGGGSNAIGLLDRFIGEPSVRLAVAEAAGEGIATGKHAAALAGGTPGILHGTPLDDAPGRRRPGPRGPLGVGRARLPGRRAADRGARRRGPARGRRPRPTTRHSRRCAGCRGPRGSCPRSRAPTPSRPCRGCWRVPTGAGRAWPEEAVVLVGLSGRGDKDLRLFGRWLEEHGS